MAYAHSVTRVTISGTAFGGVEEWSTGFFLGYEDADASNPTQTLADDIKTAWQTFFTTASSKVGSNWKTDTIKLAQWTAAGATMPENIIYSTYGTPISGASSSPALPAQISLVCTLQSSLIRGLASKGRMYLPGTTATVDATGKMTSADVLAIKNNLVTFFNAVNTAGGAAGQVILASKGRVSPAAAGVNKEVTIVKVGDVLDTQRRRRNGFTEVYTSGTLA